MQNHSYLPPNFEDLLSSAHPHLLRLCAYLTGDAEAANDLVQETLIEAWRNAHKLYDVNGIDAWLSSIARNVCLRWGRQQGRELKHSAEISSEITSVDFDLEVELERDELATLLDRALALLPPATREALIQRYILESPLSEIAGKLAISENTAAVRIHRGKLALKHILLTQFTEQAAAFGLIYSEAWQETRLWCPVCGKHRMHGVLDTARSRLGLRCPACYKAYGATLQDSCLPNVISKAKGFKTALAVMLTWSNQYFESALARNTVLCARCKHPVKPHLLSSNTTGTPPHTYHAIDAPCALCGMTNSQVVLSTVIGLPAGQRFWRSHPRIRALPEQYRVIEGQPALIIAFESLTSAARFEAAIARDTYQILYSRTE